MLETGSQIRVCGTARNGQARETPPPIPRIVVLGTSTGGPQTLQGVLSELPGDLPLAMIVVQHMPLGFTAPLAKRLDGLSKLTVREARHREALLPATVYVAPAGQHTTLVKNSHRVSICLPALLQTLSISPQLMSLCCR